MDAVTGTRIFPVEQVSTRGHGRKSIRIFQCRRQNVFNRDQSEAGASTACGLHDVKKLRCPIILLNTALIFFSALSFLGYGMACFFSGYMKQEFLRYRLGSQRLLVGGLQCGAGIGLLVGLRQPWVGQAAAGGLALMMLVAVVVRIQIKDPVRLMIPALFYLVLNVYLCLAGF